MIDEGLTKICFNICSSLIDYIYDDCNECDVLGEGCQVHNSVTSKSVTSTQITSDLEYIPKLYTDTVKQLSNIYATTDLSNETKRQCMWLGAAQFVSAALLFKLTSIYKNTQSQVVGSVSKGGDGGIFGNFLSFVGISQQMLFVRDVDHEEDEEEEEGDDGAGDDVAGGGGGDEKKEPLSASAIPVATISKHLNEFIECTMNPSSSLYETPNLVYDLNSYLDTLVKADSANSPTPTVTTVLIDCIRGIINKHVDIRKDIYYANITNKKMSTKGITLTDVK